MLAAEIITIIGVGLATIAMIGTQNWRYNGMTKDRFSDLQKQISSLDSKTDAGLEKIELRVYDLDKQMSYVDGFLEGMGVAIAALHPA